MVRKLTQKLTSEYHKYLRVWRILRKPTVSEFTMISKVTAVGLLAVGAIGFVISLFVKAIL